MLKKLKRVIKKIVQKLFTKILPWVEITSNIHMFDYPLTQHPISNIETYLRLAKEAEKNTFSFHEVDLFEKNMGFSINKNWLNHLGANTQVVIKKSPLNYAHGRVLYSALCKYLSHQTKNDKSINIVETGTARGFSSLCMAKAMFDNDYEGCICTIDLIPHNTKMYWNSISDHSHGPLTRAELLDNLSNLVDRYILFVQGSSKQMLPKLSFSRIHFAFLDGSHTYEDVMFEFNSISACQKRGDLIIFDDYNPKQFPGIVKAVNLIEENLGYKLNKIQNIDEKRGYVIAKKL